MLIPLKLYRYLGHGLKMCILFGYNPQIIFCHFFQKMNIVIFAAKVNRIQGILCIKLFMIAYIFSKTNKK